METGFSFLAGIYSLRRKLGSFAGFLLERRLSGKGTHDESHNIDRKRNDPDVKVFERLGHGWEEIRHRRIGESGVQDGCNTRDNA